MIVGQSGIGKSSFAMQMAINWALGKATFGIAPECPLRSLIVQAENDRGDIAEMLQGKVLTGLGIKSTDGAFEALRACLKNQKV